MKHEITTHITMQKMQQTALTFGLDLRIPHEAQEAEGHIVADFSQLLCFALRNRDVEFAGPKAQGVLDPVNGF